MIVVVAGVAGSGKTTVGRAVAARLGLHYLDADAFHPPANIAKMARGEALTDDDRRPWLDALNAELRRRRRRGAVLGCSALREAHRRRLASGLDPSEVRFVFLRADPEVLRRRLEARGGHFAGPDLLASQLATLELPPGAAVVDAAAPLADVVDHVLAAVSVGDGSASTDDGGSPPTG